MLLAGGTAAVLSTRQHLVAQAQSLPKDTELDSLWSTAIDGMVDVPGCQHLASKQGVLYMAPATSKNVASTDWPRIFAKSVVFSLTASNPMGIDAPDEWNQKANEALEADIRKMESNRGLSPRAWWRSFGFNAEQQWREDGFSIAFASEERVYAKIACLRLAHKYRQAAIYAYRYQDGNLIREVLWVDPSKQEPHGSESAMVVLKHPPHSELAAKQPMTSPRRASVDATPPPFAPTGRDTSVWISPREIRTTIEEMVRGK